MSALRSLERHGMRDDFRATTARLVPDLVDYRVQEVAGVLVGEIIHGGHSDSWSLNTLHESDGPLAAPQGRARHAREAEVAIQYGSGSGPPVR